MKTNEIHIRDPFILHENGTYYMYGTRAKDFGLKVGGFDVYTSSDLENWSEPTPCFDSGCYGMNSGANWAPEVHKYNGEYYMFATFADGLRGTYVLRAESPLGPFRPHSNSSVTPAGWECLDGTLYVENETPYLVFCHEHTQIIDGTICYMELSADLTHPVGDPVLLFAGSSPFWVEEAVPGVHYITDGPFLFRTKDGTLLLLWSTFIREKYAECMVRFDGGSIKGAFSHLAPLVDNDGGHGMIFKGDDALYLTYHTPNRLGEERPVFVRLRDNGGSVERVAE